jgi:hypothetical protein
MADPKAPLPQEPAPAYVNSFPEWETPRNKPKPSLLSRIRNISTAPKLTTSTAVPPDVSKEETTGTGTLPTHTSTHSTTAGTITGSRPTLRTRFNTLLPANKRYIHNRLSRRTFLIVLVALLLSLLALILGLSIGLSRKHSSAKDFIPLPSTGGIYTGDLTYYGTGLGACGWTSSDDDAIVAVSWETFDAAGGGNMNPNANPLCGKKIRVERDYGGGKGNRSIDVTVVDRCTGCKPTDLDLSYSAFDVLAERALGRVTGSWAWL